MICDLPEHGKMQANHPTPWGHLWITWQSARSVMAYSQTSMTYATSMFPTPQEPVTHNQVMDLLKSARSIGCPYMILVHSANSVTTVSMLQELHTATCLRCLQMDLWDKSVKMSFCSFCAYMGANDLSYLNHIIIVHYNTSYGCRKCLKQVFVSSSALHNHKKVCLGFAKKPTTGSNSKPSRRRQQQPRWWPHKGNTQEEGLQGSCCQLPGLQCPSGLADDPTPQWM